MGKGKKRHSFAEMLGREKLYFSQPIRGNMKENVRSQLENIASFYSMLVLFTYFPSHKYVLRL